MLTGKMVREVQTAKDDKAPQQKTILTLDFNGVTDEQAMALIATAVTIRTQNTWRKKGIPAEATVVIKDLDIGSRSVPVTAAGVAAGAKALTGEDRKALLKQLQEMEAAEAAAKQAKK